ncbi:MAG: shikimate dehydrogenase [Acidimicrobiales bacterium]
MTGPDAGFGVAAVIGHPIAHSLSPTIHNAGFAAAGLRWVYVAFDVAPGDGEAAVRAMVPLGLRGLSVTMPHKDAAARAVDSLSDDARLLGAVNCVTNHGGELVGHNTDGEGFVAALAHDVGMSPAGRSCVVFGAGGAARSVILALARHGASEIVVVNRTPERAAEAALLAPGVATTGSAARAAEADLVVNATPQGMQGASGDADLVPLDGYRSGQVVADLVYHPARTPLLDAAERGGATVTGGLGMLVHQAAIAFRLWTGVEAPVEVMRAATAAHLSRG